MLQWIQQIWATLVGLVQFATHSVASLLQLIARLPSYTAALSTAIGYLPTMYISVLMAMIAVSVIQLITGRSK